MKSIAKWTLDSNENRAMLVDNDSPKKNEFASKHHTSIKFKNRVSISIQKKR